MNAPTKTAQVEQCQVTRLNVDFSHRLGDFVTLQFKINSTSNLVDAVNSMTDRADSMLTMLESQFIGDEDCRLNDSIVYNVIESAIKEIQDIRSVVNAFHQADFLAKQNSTGGVK
ncbi:MULTISPECIES: hypothetical protein [Methylobacter]|uniref:hypothetical protein n=1 Tax=Methylobacter TaxID=429 RepID=UPI001FAC2714|nr:MULTISPECIES: hypothetical protein [Methylobacter]UOA08571.1 hypothetical protein KKZ03_20660 [Methylobacter sp. S3L5C]